MHRTKAGLARYAARAITKLFGIDPCRASSIRLLINHEGKWEITVGRPRPKRWNLQAYIEVADHQETHHIAGETVRGFKQKLGSWIYILQIIPGCGEIRWNDDQTVADDSLRVILHQFEEFEGEWVARETHRCPPNLQRSKELEAVLLSGGPFSRGTATLAERTGHNSISKLMFHGPLQTHESAWKVFRLDRYAPNLPCRCPK